MTSDVGGLAIYDIRTPASPLLAGSLVLPHALENEDVDTNGSILLMSQGSAPTMAEKQPVRTADAPTSHPPAGRATEWSSQRPPSARDVAVEAMAAPPLLALACFIRT